MPLLCLSSPKGGVGKTTLSANLALYLASHGQQVIALDLDPQNSLGLHFGMRLDREEGFMLSCREGAARRPWREELVAGPDRLHYLPYGRADMETANAISLALAVQPDRLTGPIAEMLATGATVVVDAPPGPSFSVPPLLGMADLLLIVLLVDATSIAQIPGIESGRAYGMNNPLVETDRIGFVLNQFDIRTRLGRATAEAAAQHLGSRLMGVVYRDENVPEAIAGQQLVLTHAPYSKAAQDITALGAVVLDALTRPRLEIPA